MGGGLVFELIVIKVFWVSLIFLDCVHHAIQRSGVFQDIISTDVMTLKFNKKLPIEKKKKRLFAHWKLAFDNFFSSNQFLDPPKAAVN
jgi:hypothetical protein